MAMKKVTKVRGLRFFLIGSQHKRKIKDIKIVGAVIDLPAKTASLPLCLSAPLWAKTAVLIT